VEHRLRTAILRPARDVVADRDRALLAVGDRPDALTADTVLREEVAHGLSTAGAPRDGVLARAALGGVALERDRELRVLLQPARLLLQRLLCFRRQIRAVRREVYEVADVHAEIALRTGRDWAFAVRPEQ